MGHPKIVDTHPELFPELFQKNRAGRGKSHVGTAECVNDKQMMTLMKDFQAFMSTLDIEWKVFIFLIAVCLLPATMVILFFFGIVILFFGWDTKRDPKTIY